MTMKRVLQSLLIAAGTIGAMATPVTSLAGVDIQLIFGPSPVHYEPVLAPYRGYAWVPGYWNWHGGHRVWLDGHWAREHPGHAIQHNRWIERGGRWPLERGRSGHARGRDADRDGIPDRFDRQPNNPYRR